MENKTLYPSAITSFILRHCVGADVPHLAPVIGSYVWRPLTWRRALFRGLSRETVLRLVQRLHANDVPEETIYRAPVPSCIPIATRHLYMDEAARLGYLEVVQFLHTHSARGCTNDALLEAAKHGHLEIVQFLRGHYPHFDAVAAMSLAAFGGHLPVVQYLESTGANPTQYTWEEAIMGGNVDVVKYLWTTMDGNIVTDFVASAQALEEASGYGHFDVLRWLYDASRTKRTNDATEVTADHGNLVVLEILLWCGDTEIKPDYGLAMVSAARLGNLELVKGLHSLLGSCAPLEEAWSEANMHGREEVVVYLNDCAISMIHTRDTS